MRLIFYFYFFYIKILQFSLLYTFIPSIVIYCLLCHNFIILQLLMKTGMLKWPKGPLLLPLPSLPLSPHFTTTTHPLPPFLPLPCQKLEQQKKDNKHLKFTQQNKKIKKTSSYIRIQEQKIVTNPKPNHNYHFPKTSGFWNKQIIAFIHFKMKLQHKSIFEIQTKNFHKNHKRKDKTK